MNMVSVHLLDTELFRLKSIVVFCHIPVGVIVNAVAVAYESITDLPLKVDQQLP